MSETIGNIIAKDVSARDQSENGARRGNMFTRKSGKISFGNNSGMTLLELLVVMGIIGILCGVGTVMLVRELPTIRLKQATRTLFNDVQYARMVAVRRGESFDIIRDPERANGYALVPNSRVLNGILRPGVEMKDVALKRVDLAEFAGVRFGSLDGAAPSPDSGTFTDNCMIIQPSGMSSTGSFYLRTSDADQQGRRIDVNALGRPVIRTWNGANYNER